MGLRSGLQCSRTNNLQQYGCSEFAVKIELQIGGKKQLLSTLGQQSGIKSATGNI
jgi:hypothetical protein